MDRATGAIGTGKLIALLLIEDNPGDARLVAEQLREIDPARYALTTTRCLADALLAVAQTAFDVILLDRSLPDSVGLDGLSRVHAAAPEVPIVMLTGLDDEAAATESLRNGAGDYLIKGEVTSATLSRALRYAIERKRADRALRASEQRYRAVVDNSLGLICTHDLVGRLRSVNPATAKNSGWRADELIGTNMRELIAPEARPLFDDYLNRIKENGTDSGLMRVIDKAGHEHIYAYQNSLIVDENDGPYVIGYAQDITDRRRAAEALAESESRFRTLAAHAPIGIFLTDTTGDCYYANERWCAMTGLTAEQAKGIGWIRSVHPEDKTKVLAAWQAALQSGREFAMEHRALSSDGRSLWLHGSTAAQRDARGTITGYVGTVTDVTAQHNAREDLLAKTEELAQAYAKLDETRREQLHIKDKLLSHVSHELRTPLTAIYQFTTILRDGLAGELSAEQREYLDIVVRNIKQLRGMIGDLLDISRADSDKLSIAPQATAVGGLVAEMVQMFQAAAAEKQVKLESDIASGLPAVLADATRVRQVLTNLLDNALKFTPAQGRVRVAAEISADSPGFVRIRVADSGCGISAEGTRRIFERLYQEPSTHHASRQGLGLGLYLCQEIISRHGGRIWVESKLDRGSIFFFTLPLAEGADITRNEGVPPTSPSHARSTRKAGKD